MKLTKVEVKNFRSIHHTVLNIDDQLTTLVGANEHGKSNLLMALSYIDQNKDLDLSEDQRITNEADSLLPDIIFHLELNDLDIQYVNKEININLSKDKTEEEKIDFKKFIINLIIILNTEGL
jgi:predicted ATP-dependent endonuclease of OLD family